MPGERSKHTKKNTAIKIIIALATISALFWGYQSLDLHQENNDALGYIMIAQHIVESGSFTDDAGNYTREREPAYPLFLAVIFRVFGVNAVAVWIIQVLLFGASAFLVFRIGEELFHFRIGFFSALIFSLFPSLAGYTSSMLTEAFFTFLLLCTFMVFLQAARRNSMFLFAALGLLSGALVLTRALGVSVAIVLTGWLLLFGNGKIARRIARCAVVLLCFIILVGAWTVRNHIRFGGWDILPRSGSALNLYGRALTAKLSRTDALAYTAASFFGDFFAAKIFPGFAGIAQSVYLVADRDIAQWRSAHPGADSREQDAYFRSQSLAIIKEHPMQYVLLGIAELGKLYSPLLVTSDTHHMFTGTHPELPEWLKGFSVLLLRISWAGFFIIAFWAIAKTALRDSRVAAIAFFLGLYSIAASAFYVSARYLLPLHAFYYLFFVYGILWWLPRLAIRF